MILIHSLFSSYLLVVISLAQNVTTPTDDQQIMNSSLEITGAGATNFRPSETVRNQSGQYEVKINEEQNSSANIATLMNKRLMSKLHSTGRKMMIKVDNTKLTAKSLKNCFGFTVTIPVTNIVVTPAPTTTTGGTPDVRGGSTTTVST